MPRIYNIFVLKFSGKVRKTTTKRDTRNSFYAEVLQYKDITITDMSEKPLKLPFLTRKLFIP